MDYPEEPAALAAASSVDCARAVLLYYEVRLSPRFSPSVRAAADSFEQSRNVPSRAIWTALMGRMFSFRGPLDAL